MAKVGQMVKEGTVQELTVQLSERPNFFIARLNRLPAPDADMLRRQLFGSKAHLLVVKRKLGQRVLSELKLTGLAELLEGSVGLVLAEDDVPATAKLLVEFRKTHEEGIALRGAVVDGQLLDAGRVEFLAQLPPRPILLAHVLGMIEAPISDVIFTIERLIGDLAWIAEQAAAQKPAAPAPPATETAPAPEGASPAPSAGAPPPTSAQEPTAPKHEEGTAS
jgi:large subunit ribosomal protein L10